jgi:DNA-binding transcriptional MerR regulator
MKNNKYTIKELSDITGYPRRTIRYYIQIGLLESPEGRGRRGLYSDSQLTKLKTIKSLQEKGMSLSAIIDYLKAGKSAEKEGFAREIWTRYEIISGIELLVRKDIEDRNSKKIFELIRVTKSITRGGIKDG